VVQTAAEAPAFSWNVRQGPDARWQGNNRCGDPPVGYNRAITVEIQFQEAIHGERIVPVRYLLAMDGLPPGRILLAWFLWIFIGEILPIVLLVCCWQVGDLKVTTKLLLTFLYLGHFGLVFVTTAPYLYLVAKPVLVGIIGTATFGVSWLNRRKW
jgi:hypothetical protein